MASEWLAEDPNHALLVNDDPEQEGYQLCDIDEDEITVFTMAENSFSSVVATWTVSLSSTTCQCL